MKLTESYDYRVLVVDDDDAVRDLTRRMLQETGLKCDVARDGVEAENALRFNRFDAIVTDLRMPRKHGHQFIREITAKTPHPVIVVLTGICEPRLVMELMKFGVSEVALKPCNYDLLAAKIRAFLLCGDASAPSKSPAKMVPVEVQIERVTRALNAQLAAVTNEFQKTIESLTKQKESLEDGFLRSVRVLENLMSLGPGGEESHASRVERMSEALGKSCGLQHVELQHLRVAALLHDIGRFGMPDEIRHSAPQALASDQFSVYQRYPLIGAAVVAEIPGLEEVVTLIESHAENYDGSGFPAQRKGEGIPLGARILRLGDGLDTHLSQHADGDSLEAARIHLGSQRGKAYDPELVPLALQILTENSLNESQNNTTVISVEALKEGMTLAEGIYDAHGQFLVREGAPLTPSMLTLLRRLIPRQSIRIQSMVSD